MLFGISVFTGLKHSLRENTAYIIQAKKSGFNSVFSSLHIPESSGNCSEEMESIIQVCKDLKMELIVDISKSYFQKSKILELDFSTLRLDFGFSENEIIELSERKKIWINASTLNEAYIKELLKKGLKQSNVIACYNYYPRPESGISIDLFRERNTVLKKFQFKIVAFVPSHYQKRAPLFAGLPTLEKHRNVLPFVAAQELLHEDLDGIFIGDSMASSSELEAFKAICQEYYVIPVRLSSNISIVEKHILELQHMNRWDPPCDGLRSSYLFNQESPYEHLDKIEPINNDLRAPYTVCIDNYKYARYQGNLHVPKKQLPADPKVNVVGDASLGEILIERIKPGEKFEFYSI